MVRYELGYEGYRPRLSTTKYFWTRDDDTGKSIRAQLSRRPSIFKVLEVGSKKTIKGPLKGKHMLVRELYVEFLYIQGRNLRNNKGQIQVTEKLWQKFLLFSDWLVKQGFECGDIICHYKERTFFYEHQWMYVKEEYVDTLIDVLDTTEYERLKWEYWWFYVASEVDDTGQIYRQGVGDINFNENFYAQYDPECPTYIYHKD